MNCIYKAKTIKLNPQKELPVIGVKIIDEQYASDFINKGVIHFSNPKIWRDPKKCSGKQLDEDEGCFCFSIENNDLSYSKAGRCFERTQVNGGWKYFEKTDKIVGTCLYGILKSDFQEREMRYGVRTMPSQNITVPKTYFDNFTVNTDKEEKTIIIFYLPRFCNMVVDKCIEMGAQKEEIFITTVYYVDKKIPFCTLEPFPFEYFLKDNSFSSQAELRIIIASKNEEFYRKLQESNNNIIIGDISKFAVVQDKYKFDLDLSIQGNKLLYKLSTPISLSLDDRSFAELVGELYQILQNLLPGEPKSQDELQALTKPIIEHLKYKYNVEYRDDWRLYNVPYELYLSLPDLYKGMCNSIV